MKSTFSNICVVTPGRKPKYLLFLSTVLSNRFHNSKHMIPNYFCNYGPVVLDSIMLSKNKMGPTIFQDLFQ